MKNRIDKIFKGTLYIFDETYFIVEEKLDKYSYRITLISPFSNDNNSYHKGLTTRMVESWISQHPKYCEMLCDEQLLIGNKFEALGYIIGCRTMVLRTINIGDEGVMI